MCKKIKCSINWPKVGNFLLTKIWSPIWTFVKNVPRTLGESFFWLLFTFFLPAVQVFLKYVLTGKIELNNDLVCIILVAIVSLYVSINLLNFSNERKRKLVLALSIIGYGISLILFSIVKAEIIKETTLIDSGNETVKITVYVLFSLSVILALISKYDEVSANSRRLAEKGKEKTETQVGGKKYNIS